MTTRTSRRTASTYRAGEWIEIAAKFNGRAAVDGEPILGIFFSGSGGLRYGEFGYRRGSGTDTLVFGYQVDVRDRNVDYEVQPNSIFGGTVYGVWTNGTHHREDAAVRAMPNGYSEKPDVHGRPYVRSVSVTSRPRVGDTYGRGEKVEVQVTSDQEVVVSGQPVLGLTVGGAWRGAGYTRPNGTRYEGEWRDGRPNGHGTYTGSKGTRYEGKWRDGCIGKRDGYWVAVFTSAAECGFE